MSLPHSTGYGRRTTRRAGRLHHFYLAATVAAITILGGCKTREVQAVKAAEPPAVMATVVAVQPSSFTSIVAITGSLVSKTRVDVKAETLGRVSRFPKEEGDRVRAGEAVLWVDEENYRLNVRQAESAVQVAEAALARARVLETHGHAELERARNLIQSGGITDKDLKLAIVTEQEARSQTQLCQAQLDQAKAALEVSRKHLRDAVVVAPVDGEIQKKFVNVGAYVEAPTMVFTIVDNRKLELEASVPTSELGDVRSGQSVSFTVNSYPGETFHGRIVDINPAVDAESRSAKARIQVDNSGSRLKAGMFVQGEILTGVRREALVIPGTALYRDDRSSLEGTVFVIDSGKAVRRKVRIGHEREGRLEVIAGLKAGDQLITEQSVELAEGVRIQTKEANHVSQ